MTQSTTVHAVINYRRASTHEVVKWVSGSMQQNPLSAFG
jgi:hypothetical protein